MNVYYYVPSMGVLQLVTTPTFVKGVGSVMALSKPQRSQDKADQQCRAAPCGSVSRSRRLPAKGLISNEGLPPSLLFVLKDLLQLADVRDPP